MTKPCNHQHYENGCRVCHLAETDPRYSDLWGLAVPPVQTDRSLISQDRLTVLAQAARQCCHLPGDFAELGCFRGGSAKVIASACPNKKLHLYDTFAGIPEDDVFASGHKKGDFATNLDEVKSYLWGHNVEFHVGFFPETAYDTTYSFVHLDADLYTSTRAGIEFFYPRLVESGICCFDDFQWEHCEGVEKAINELLPDLPMKRLAGYQCLIQKPAKKCCPQLRSKNV